MGVYIVRRLMTAVPVVVLASLFVFAILQLVPGDAAVSLAGPDASDADVQVIRERLGLDRPLVVQYLSWAGNALRGDLGHSFRSSRPVITSLRESAGPTLELATFAFAIELMIGVPLGVMAGVRPRSLWDWGLSLMTVGGVAIPHFVLGLVMLYVFSFRFGWFPVGGRVALTDNPLQGMRSLVLPALVLGLTGASVLARFVRSSVSQVMNQDYIRTARAKGLREWSVIVRHTLRNGLIAVITVVSLQLAALLTGSVVIENVFSRPGVGRLVVNAIQGRDYPVVQGTLLFLVGVFILINLTADVLYGVVDPRIRLR